ncbi:hypothetical protein L9F63_015390, partial [Diploptera punctata]
CYFGSKKIPILWLYNIVSLPSNLHSEKIVHDSMAYFTNIWCIVLSTILMLTKYP